MRALVTGGGGFLGGRMVDQLAERGDDVTVFARGEYSHLAEKGVRLVRGDLRDATGLENACRGMDVVFHVAAQAGIWGPWESFYQPNVLGTRNVLQACRKNGVTRLVYTSSPSVVFDNRGHARRDESLAYPERYENFYSQTKAMAEREVLAANGQDLLTVALRPHLIWGPGDPHLLPRLVARARAGKLIQVGDGKNKVDMTVVEDAAMAHLLAADVLTLGSPAAGSAYFITQDDPVVLWDWIAALLARLGIPPVKHRISLPLARSLGQAMELLYRLLRLRGEPRLTRFLASELALSHTYDISRAKKDLGYAPRITMAEALEKTLAWILETSPQRR